MRIMEFDDAVDAYKHLIEDSDQALPLLVVDIKDSPPMVFGVHVNDEARPAQYVRAIGAQLKEQGQVIERMTWQCEAWIHIMDLEGNATGLEEAVTILMRDISGEEKAVYIPFVRMEDGVHWREPDYEGQQAGDLIDALRWAVS